MEKTLVILAAGMGSRFGGLKQIEPVGPCGEVIADYSVYDAIKAGFKKVVFVIKKENLEYFKENITNKFENKIKVEFAFQSLDNVPNISSSRIKPLGTAHALLVTKTLVNDGFVMINSDDFYGRDAYLKASDFLDKVDDENEYLSVNYPFNQACSKKGSVNRGLVTELDGYIKSIDESSMEISNDIVLVTNKLTGEKSKTSLTHPVSLNFFAFKPSIYKILENEYQLFISKPILDTDEFMLTDVIKKYLGNNTIKFKSAKSDDSWLGVTYKDDLEDVKLSILKLIEEGVYPRELWK